MKLSANFSLAEMVKSQTAERKGIDNTPDTTARENMVKLCENILQPVRDHYGVPFTVSSGYRCPELCLAVGSTIKSQHAKGQAADFEVPASLAKTKSSAPEYFDDTLSWRRIAITSAGTGTMRLPRLVFVLPKPLH